MVSIAIEGVEFRELDIFQDSRGFVSHFMRKDREPFERFGEVYFSACYPTAVKAWHLHREMTLNYVCIKNAVKVVLVDGRPKSPTYKNMCEYVLEGHPFMETLHNKSDEAKYGVLTIPPGVWNGYTCWGWYKLSGDPSIIANFADMPHDPDEIERVHPDEFGLASYDWGKYKVAG